MVKQTVTKALGVIGGSFDPVHYGHLRVAIEFAEAFALEQVNLLPCYQSPHRSLPQANAEQRLTMLQLAVQSCAQLAVDNRELQQQGLSYTVDTLAHIRQQLGNDTAIYFAMGADAFTQIERWKNWQYLFELANIVVLHRPGYSLTTRSAWILERQRVFQGQHHMAGGYYEQAVTALGISATQIRQLAKQQQSLRFLLPETVEHYIQQQRLYQ